MKRFTRLLLATGIMGLTVSSTAMAADEKLSVTSTTVQDGKAVPVEHTGDGKDESPAISWSKASAQVKAYALTCEDPDAPGGTWFHWIVFNMPAATTSLKAGVDKVAKLPDGSSQGTNDFGKLGYNGPAPPKGSEHHYHYKVFGLDGKLKLKPGCDKKEFYDAIKGHVLAQGQLTGLYKRP